MNILVWHVHESWTRAFVQGRHRYLLPALPERGPWGLGRAGRDWPDRAVEVWPDTLADFELDVDVVVLQRVEELDLTERMLGRRVGSDLPAVYVEHHAPNGPAASTFHPLGDRNDIPIVHMTHYNELMWDNGRAPTVVIGHGIVDPGYRYTGLFDRAATMINEPIRRERCTGFDLLDSLGEEVPIDLYGIGTDAVRTERVTGHGNLPTARVHAEISRRRVYVHTARWTPLGPSLLEAMHLGMPVVVVGSTEAFGAVPPEAGVVSTDPHILAQAIRCFAHEPTAAATAGKAARHAALTSFGLDGFLTNWDHLLANVTH